MHGQCQTQYEALLQKCEAASSSLDATIRTDMDQIITSKEHVTNKIRGEWQQQLSLPETLQGEHFHTVLICLWVSMLITHCLIKCSEHEVWHHSDYRVVGLLFCAAVVWMVLVFFFFSSRSSLLPRIPVFGLTATSILSVYSVKHTQIRFHHLRNPSELSLFLYSIFKHTETLEQAFISSHLHYHNSLFTSLNQKSCHGFQTKQNSAARL